MKKLIFILILSFWGVKSYAQNINLNQLPKSERDSLLLAASKEAMLTYAPEWYRKDIIPVIKYFGPSKRESDNGRIFYTVTYYVDKSKESDNWDFMADVFVWDDNAKVTTIVVGSGLMLMDLDQVPKTRNNKNEQIPYYSRPAPSFVIKEEKQENL